MTCGYFGDGPGSGVINDPIHTGDVVLRNIIGTQQNCNFGSMEVLPQKESKCNNNC